MNGYVFLAITLAVGAYFIVGHYLKPRLERTIARLEDDLAGSKDKST